MRRLPSQWVQVDHPYCSVVPAGRPSCPCRSDPRVIDIFTSIIARLWSRRDLNAHVHDDEEMGHIEGQIWSAIAGYFIEVNQR
jgi:hypothetical protein